MAKKSRVGQESRSAHGSLKAAAGFAQEGKCSLALQTYSMGVGHLALATDHAGDFDMDPDFDDVQRSKALYEKIFIQKCLVGGGLSGLRRRPSRRKARR